MGKHSDLPDEDIIHNIYTVSLPRKKICFVDVLIELDCRRCVTKCMRRILFYPYDGKKVRYKWYHIGCALCRTHAVDFRVNEKELVAFCYPPQHYIQVNLSTMNIKTE